MQYILKTEILTNNSASLWLKGGVDTTPPERSSVKTKDVWEIRKTGKSAKLVFSWGRKPQWWTPAFERKVKEWARETVRALQSSPDTVIYRLYVETTPGGVRMCNLEILLSRIELVSVRPIDSKTFELDYTNNVIEKHTYVMNRGFVVAIQSVDGAPSPRDIGLRWGPTRPPKALPPQRNTRDLAVGFMASEEELFPPTYDLFPPSAWFS